MIICKNCGQQLSDNVSFCVYCGTPVQNIQSNQTAQAEEPQAAQPNVQPAQEKQPAQPAQQQYQQPNQPYGQPAQQQYQQPAQPYGQPAQGQYQQPNQPYGQPAQGQYRQPYQPYGQPVQGQYQQNYQAQQPISPEEDVQKNKNIAWLSYLGILLLIPMFARKYSDFCQYHVKQGATLFCIHLIYTIGTRILLAIIGAIFPGHYSFGAYSYTEIYVNSGVYTFFSVIFSLVSIGFFVLAILGIVNAAGGKKKPLPIIGEVDIIAKLLDKYYNKK